MVMAYLHARFLLGKYTMAHAKPLQGELVLNKTIRNYMFVTSYLLHNIVCLPGFSLACTIFWLNGREVPEVFFDYENTWMVFEVTNDKLIERDVSRVRSPRMTRVRVMYRCCS